MPYNEDLWIRNHLKDMFNLLNPRSITMTLHSFLDYQCSSCGVHYIPLPVAPNCPNCNYEPTVVFQHFIENVIRSALSNLKQTGSFVPHFDIMVPISNEYRWLAFNLLSFAADMLKVDRKGLLSLDISEDTAKYLAFQFMGRFDFGEEEYMLNTFEPYCVNLLLRLKEVAN